MGDIVDDYWRMNTEVFAKWSRKPPVGPEFFVPIAEMLDETDTLWTLAAYHEDRIVAAAIFPHFRETAYYAAGVSSAAGNSTGANNLLQWHLIGLAIDSGVRTYDMVGANVPSIAKFKASFGAEWVEYTWAHKSFSLRARTGRWAYRKIMPVVRKLKYRIFGR